MRKFLHLFIFIAAVLTVFACTSVESGTAAGRASDRIVIYTSMYENVITAVEAILGREFPGLNIEFVYGGTGFIQSRIINEHAAGRLGCDILMVGEPAYSLELKELNLLHSFASSEASNLNYDHDPDGFWYPVRVSAMVMAFNPARYSRDSIPQSFNNFAQDQSVRGAISMSNPLTSGTTMAAVTALRDRYGYEYFDALGRQNVTIESGAVALTKLETGEHRVIMILEESVLQKRQQEGSRLEVIYPADGNIIIPSTIMIVAEEWSANRNIAAAEAIANWFLGQDGQNAIVDGWMHTVRRDLNRVPFDSIGTEKLRSNSMNVNWDHYFRQRDEIRERFENYITNRR